LNNQVIDNAVGLVDVMDGAIAQPAYGGIILFARNVIVSFVEQFLGAVKAARAVHVRIDGRMVVQVLAIINRSVLDFLDSFVNLVNGVFFFLIHVMRGREIFKMSTGVAKIGKGVQVCGMASRFVGETESGAKSKNKGEYGAMSESFHGFL